MHRFSSLWGEPIAPESVGNRTHLNNLRCTTQKDRSKLSTSFTHSNPEKRKVNFRSLNVSTANLNKSRRPKFAFKIPLKQNLVKIQKGAKSAQVTWVVYFAGSNRTFQEQTLFFCFK